MYQYPQTLPRQGAPGFVEAMNRLLHGGVDDQEAFLPPSVRPKGTARPNCPSTETAHETVTLTFYQKAVATLFHPQSPCRSLLVIAGTGSGKTCMVTAVLSQMMDYSLYPNPKGIDPLERKQFRQAYPEAVPSRVYYVTYSDKLQHDLFVAIGNECPGMSSSPYHREFRARVVQPLYDTAKQEQKASPSLLGEIWCRALGVIVISYPKLGNGLEGAGTKERNIKTYRNALFLLDEIDTVLNPKQLPPQVLKNLSLITELTVRVKPVFGLCGFTATPIATGIRDMLDLNRLFCHVTPELQGGGDAEALLSGKAFMDRFMEQTDLPPPKVPMVAPLKDFLRMCRVAKRNTDMSQAQKAYFHQNRIRQKGVDVLAKVFDRMRHYVVFYDNSTDLAAFPRRTWTYILSDGTATEHTTMDDTISAVDRRDLHLKWTLKSLQVSAANSKKKLSVETVDWARVPRLRTTLTSSLFVWSSLLRFGSKPIFADPVRFRHHLMSFSPTLYECFKRLTRRVGKSIVFANVVDHRGVKFFHGILERYVLARPTDNELLPLPEGLTTDQVMERVRQKLVLVTRPREPSKKQENESQSRIAAFSRDGTTDPLSSPILFLGSRYGVGVSIKGGVREMHVLDWTIDVATDKQAEGRPYRRNSHCGLKHPDEWRIDFYKYMNVGAYPWAMTSCDLLFYYVRQASNVEALNSYLLDLYRRSSLTCRAFRDGPHTFIAPPGRLVARGGAARIDAVPDGERHTEEKGGLVLLGNDGGRSSTAVV